MYKKKKILILSISLYALSSILASAETFTGTPIADGTYSNWSPSTGKSHYNLISEDECNGKTDYVSANNINDKESYVVNLAGIPDGSVINSISITPCASRNSNGNENGAFDVFFRINNLDSNDAGNYVVTGNTPVQLNSTTFTNISTIKSSTTTLEIGTVFTSGKKSLRLSKISSIITYTPAPVTYNIEASSEGYGDITPTGITGVTKGSNQTFTFTPNNNNVIKDVLIDDTSVGFVNTYTFTDVQEPHTIKVIFVPKTTVPTSTLAAYYKLEDLEDSSGNNRTLTSNGSVPFVSGGKINNYSKIDDYNIACNKYLSRRSDNFGITGGPVTISAWYKPLSHPETGQYHSIVTQSDSSTNVQNWLAYANDGVHNFIWFNRQKQNIENDNLSYVTTLPLNTWSHIAYTYDGQTVKGYLNGSYIGSKQSTGQGLSGVNSGVYIGCVSGNSNEFSWQPNGSIDEVGIWSSALQDSEILELYNSGSGLQYPF